MGKRVDNNDATQEVSSSQLVPDARPLVKPPVLGSQTNDASMWMQAPVSVDDFVGAAKKKKPARRGKGRVYLFAAVAVVLVTAVGGGVWYAFLRESPVQTAASSPAPAASSSATSATSSPATAAAGTPVATAPIDAGAAPDAATAATVDAAAPTVATLAADAVSAAGKRLDKPSPTKRAPVRKKVVKKKTATVPKKRR